MYSIPLRRALVTGSDLPERAAKSGDVIPGFTGNETPNARSPWARDPGAEGEGP